MAHKAQRPITDRQNDGSIDMMGQEVLALVKNHPLFHNISIEKNLDPSLPMVDTDVSQIYQVFIKIE